MRSAVWRARSSGLDTTRSTPLSASPIASAWAIPTSSNGGSRRPTRRPLALKALRPWRTRISTPTVEHTGGRGQSDEGGVEVAGPPEDLAAAAIRQAEAPPRPDEHGQPDELEHEAHAAPVERRQRLRTEPCPADGPPERVAVGESAVEDQVQE